MGEVSSRTNSDLADPMVMSVWPERRQKHDFLAPRMELERIAAVALCRTVLFACHSRLLQSDTVVCEQQAA